MKNSFAALMILVLSLAACGSPQSNQALPTLIPTLGGVQGATVTPAASPTQQTFTRPTLPPTWTPAPGSVDSDGNTSGDSSGIATPTPETLNTPVPYPTDIPTLVVCGTFVADRSRST